MHESRILNWDGGQNFRDLGGLPAGNGERTRRGALVRGGDPCNLKAAGWQALIDHGVRTIISLQTDGMDEETHDAAPRPASLTTLRMAIEDVSDAEFVERWVNTSLWGTPLYFLDTLKRWPQKHAAVLGAIGRAAPGGVLFHCRRGNDRTGIIALLLLAFAGVPAAVIAEDYELSPDEVRDELLRRRGTSCREVIEETLAGLDVEAYLLSGGLGREELQLLRARFLETLDAGH